MFIPLGCGCLLALGASVMPRAIYLLVWLINPTIVSQAFSGNWIWPTLGVIFVPYTTIMYTIVWNPAGIGLWGWLMVLLGVWLDVAKWGQIYNNRQQVPYYPAAEETI